MVRPIMAGPALTRAVFSTRTYEPRFFELWRVEEMYLAVVGQEIAVWTKEEAGIKNTTLRLTSNSAYQMGLQPTRIPGEKDRSGTSQCPAAASKGERSPKT